jgi:WD40 repeat protein
LTTYELLSSVHAHEESVLSLDLSDDGSLLFSSGGDSVVNVSDMTTALFPCAALPLPPLLTVFLPGLVHCHPGAFVLHLLAP